MGLLKSSILTTAVDQTKEWLLNFKCLLGTEACNLWYGSLNNEWVLCNFGLSAVDTPFAPAPVTVNDIPEIEFLLMP